MAPPPPPGIGLGALFVISLLGLIGVLGLLLYALDVSPSSVVKAVQRQLQKDGLNEANLRNDQIHEPEAVLEPADPPPDLRVVEDDSTSDNDSDNDVNAVANAAGAEGGDNENGNLRQRKSAKRRQAKQAQIEARRAAREQAKQLAIAAEAARRQRAEKAASVLAAKGVDVSGDTLWSQKQKELDSQAAARHAAEAKGVAQQSLKTAAAREALAKWLLTVNAAPISTLAQNLGVDDTDVLAAVSSVEAKAAGATVTKTADNQLIAFSQADTQAFVELVRGSAQPLTAGALVEACARANIPSRSGRSDATERDVQMCCSQIIPSVGL